MTSEYNGIKIKADVTSRNHLFSIKIKSPESLNGYTYKYDNAKTSISYDNLLIEADESYLPKNSFPSIIINVLKTIDSEELNYSGNYNNKAKYNGKCESGNFVVTGDYNTGYISELELKDLGFTADFPIK